MALEEETSTNTLGKRYSGKEGPIRGGKEYTKIKTPDSSWARPHTLERISWRLSSGISSFSLQGQSTNLLRQFLMAMHHTTVATKPGNWSQLQSLAVLCLFPGATGGFHV